MKKAIPSILLLSALLTSCNTESLYTTEPCDISIHIAEGTPTASYVLVNFSPKDEKTYYFAGILTQEEFSKIGNFDRLMQVQLDYEYKEYINWRYDLLLEEEEFIASFSSHNLYYGKDSRYFRELQPNTTYVLYAFCVDPNTIKPIGNLYHVPFTTTDRKQSDLSFQVLFKQREDAAYISIIPSSDDEPYLWSWVRKSFLIENNITAETYGRNMIDMFREYGFGEELYSKGAETAKCGESTLSPGEKYILMAIGFDGESTTDLYTLEFEYPFLTEGPIYLGE